MSSFALLLVLLLVLLSGNSISVLAFVPHQQHTTRLIVIASSRYYSPQYHVPSSGPITALERTTTMRAPTTTTTSLSMLPADFAALLISSSASASASSSLWTADAAVVEAIPDIPATAGGGIFETIQTIAAGVTALVFFLAGLTLVMANIIIPAAANELEKECKELAPEKWDEYQAKLEPGETIAQRPDLMQALGSELQPLLDVKIAAIAEKEGVSVEEMLARDVPFQFVSKEEAAKRKETAENAARDNDNWSSTPQVDLSDITDAIEVPSTASSEEQEDGEGGDDEDSSRTAK